MAAEIGVLECKTDQLGEASMGPQLIGCGDSVQTVTPGYATTALQWGRS